MAWTAPSKQTEEPGAYFNYDECVGITPLALAVAMTSPCRGGRENDAPSPEPLPTHPRRITTPLLCTMWAP